MRRSVLITFPVIALVACANAKSPSETGVPAIEAGVVAVASTSASASAAPITAPGPMRCEGTSIKNGAKEYCLMKARRTFDQASAECDRMSGRLAVLSDAGEASAIAAKLVSPWGYGSGMWLGCTDEDAEGNWKCNGKKLTYTNWAPGKPDNDTALDDCQEWLADTGQWNDASCAWKLGYVCRGDSKFKCNGRSVAIAGGSLCAHGDDQQDWDGAKKACEKAGAKLAVILTADESAALTNALALPSQIPSFQPNEGVWIGLTDQKEEGKFRWSNDTALATGNWMAGQPDDSSGGEDCATLTLSDGKWNDLDCIRALPYLCEAK